MAVGSYKNRCGVLIEYFNGFDSCLSVPYTDRIQLMLRVTMDLIYARQLTIDDRFRIIRLIFRDRLN